MPPQPRRSQELRDGPNDTDGTPKKAPVIRGLLPHGRGGFRTCDLSRVKFNGPPATYRALSLEPVFTGDAAIGELDPPAVCCCLVLPKLLPRAATSAVAISPEHKRPVAPR